MTAPHLRKLCVVNLVTGTRRLVSREEAGPLPEVEVINRLRQALQNHRVFVVAKSHPLDRTAADAWYEAGQLCNQPKKPWAIIRPDADHTDAELIALAWAWLVARANRKG